MEGQRPVINLKSLNRFVHTEHFKMEGLHICELGSTRTEPSSRECEKDQGRNSAPFGRTITFQPAASGQTATGNQGSAPGSSVLPQAATSTAEGAGAVRTGLFSPINPLHRGGGAGMVVGPSVCLEWQDHYDRQTLISDTPQQSHMWTGWVEQCPDWIP